MQQKVFVWLVIKISWPIFYVQLACWACNLGLQELNLNNNFLSLALQWSSFVICRISTRSETTGEMKKWNKNEQERMLFWATKNNFHYLCLRGVWIPGPPALEACDIPICQDASPNSIIIQNMCLNISRTK